MIDEEFNLAAQLLRSGRLPEAERQLRQILTRHPNHADALHALGVLAAQVGRYDAAIELIGRAISINPDSPEAHGNLGTALHRSGKLEEAAAAYRRVIALDPNLVEAHANLGVVLLAQGKLDDAIFASRHAIGLNPNHAEAHHNLGHALERSGQLDDAIAAYRRTVGLQPDHAEAHNNLGVALAARGLPNDAMMAYRKAIALRPDSVEAYINLAVLLAENGLLVDAITISRQAIAINPNSASAYYSFGHVLRHCGQLDEAIAAFRQAIAIDPNCSSVHSTLLYSLYFHPAYDGHAIAFEHANWNKRHAEPLKGQIKVHSNDPSPNRRLRIGYVSPDFRKHPVGRFLLPLLENHDRQNHDIFAYSNSLVSDAMTDRIRTSTDCWRSIVGISDAQAANLIREDRIDILVDLTLHMAHSRPLIFALKPAPVQVTYLAYAGTSGLSTMDYRLSDPYLDSPGGDESIYSEQTVRLPETYWCYAPVTQLPLVDPPSLKNKFVTFGCLNAFNKVNETVLNVWSQLLREVPHSRLILHAHEGDHRRRVLEYFQSRDVEASRISFLGKVSTEAYFELYQLMDIDLDTFPYGGGTTSCDALWMGVPVICLAGPTAVGRGGMSILSNLGISEFVAKSAEKYVYLASHLANDLGRLTELRATLRSTMESSPLMDGPRFARGIESAYRWMWQQWCK